MSLFVCLSFLNLADSWIRVNMKTIMAETATASTVSQGSLGSPGKATGTTEIPDAGPSTSPRSFQKPSQRQRRKMDSQNPLVGSESIQLGVSSASPWKLPDRQAPIAASPISISVREPQSDVPIHAMHPSSSTPRAVSQVSKAQPATPISVPVSNSSFRPDTAAELVPRRSHA